MFIRKKKSANSEKRTVEIVKNERFADKIRQTIKAYIGVIRLPEDELRIMALAQVKLVELIKEENAQKKLLTDAEALKLSKRGKRKKEVPMQEEVLGNIAIENLREEYRLVEGLQDIGSKALEAFNFGSLFRTKKQNTLFKDLIITRLGYAQSKRGLCATMKSKMNLSYTEDQIYRLMDNLYPKIDLIKRKIFNHTQALMPSVNVLLFDVTTLYCESAKPDGLRHFGFSKDGKFNNTQVVLALATNERGLPIGYEVFSGNCAEVNTLFSAIQRWQHFLPIKKICFIGDRAMFSEDNLHLMESHGYDYIIAAKLRSQSSAIQEKILDETRYQSVTFGDEVGRVADFDVTPEKVVFRCALNKTQFGYNATLENEQIVNITYVDPQGEIHTAESKAFSALQSKIQGIKRYTHACPSVVMTGEEYALKQEDSQNDVVILHQPVQLLLMKPSMEIPPETLCIYADKKQWIAHSATSTHSLSLTHELSETLTKKYTSQELLSLAERQAILKSVGQPDYLIYKKKHIILYDLSPEIQDSLEKKIIRGKIPASLMRTIFTEYQGERYIHLSGEQLMKLFPKNRPVYRRLCVSYRPTRAHNDAYKREKILSRLASKEGKVNGVLKTVAKLYMTTDGKAQIDQAKISIAERWDGLHGIITNIRQEKAQDLIGRYSQLWRIEESFRINKHQLSMRPMYHYKPERIHAHLAICYITFAVLRLIEYQTALTQKGLSVDEILYALANTEASIYCDISTQKRYKIPGYLSDNAKKLYKSFGLQHSNIPTRYFV